MRTPAQRQTGDGDFILRVEGRKNKGQRRCEIAEAWSDLHSHSAISTAYLALQQASSVQALIMWLFLGTARSTNRGRRDVALYASCHGAASA